MADWVTGVLLLLLLQRQHPYITQKCFNLVPGQVVVAASNQPRNKSTAEGYQPDKETRLCHITLRPQNPGLDLARSTG